MGGISDSGYVLLADIKGHDDDLFVKERDFPPTHSLPSETRRPEGYPNLPFECLRPKCLDRFLLPSYTR